MDPDTGIGGAQERFPATRHSALLAARSADPAERARGCEALIAAYWLKWRASSEDAKDLTQVFFARAIEKGYFGVGNYTQRLCCLRSVQDRSLTVAAQFRNLAASSFP